jgi:hypothetical protein
VQTPVDPALFRGGRGLPLSRAFGLGVNTILLDPGHGGEDTGCIGLGGTREKEIALDIARRLKRRLEARTSYEVLMTRDADVTLPLGERVAIAHATTPTCSSRSTSTSSRTSRSTSSRPSTSGRAPAPRLELARREKLRPGAGMSELSEIIERMETRCAGRSRRGSPPPSRTASSATAAATTGVSTTAPSAAPSRAQPERGPGGARRGLLPEQPRGGGSASARRGTARTSPPT